MEVIKLTEEKVLCSLNKVKKDYIKRYEYGDYNCLNLFNNIENKIRNLIFNNIKNNEITLTKILILLEGFSKQWENKETDCDDTDGIIHINSIQSEFYSFISVEENNYNKIIKIDETENIDNETNLEIKNENEKIKREKLVTNKKMVILYTIYLFILFILFVLFVP